MSALVLALGCAPAREEAAWRAWEDVEASLRVEGGQGEGRAEAAAVSSALAGRPLADWVAVAEARSPRLGGHAARWRAALARVPQARGLPPLRVGVGVMLEHVQTRVGPMEQQVMLQQMLPWPGKLVAEVDAALAEADVRAAELEAERRALAAEVTAAAAALWALGREQELVAESAALVRDWEALARTRLAVGAPGAHGDALRAQLELGRVEDRLASLEDERRPLDARLRALLHLPPGPALPWPAGLDPRRLPGDPGLPPASEGPGAAGSGAEGSGAERPGAVAPEPGGRAPGREHAHAHAHGGAAPQADAAPDPAPGGALDEAGLLRRVRERGPLADVVARRVQAQREGAARARQGWFPDLMLGFEYQTIGRAPAPVRGSGQDAYAVQVGLDLPLWAWATRGRIDEADALVRAAERDAEDALDRAEAAAARALFAYRDAARKERLYALVLLPRAEQLRAAASAAYQAGEGGFLELLDAERQVLELRLELARAQAARATALAELEALAGAALAGPG